jgi:hypothetical protein
MKYPQLVMGHFEPLYTPIVYVHDPAKWEYQRLERDTPMDEAELNSIGGEGWELVGVVPLEAKLYFYFKRLE